MAVLKAYFDDSGSPAEKGHTFLTIGGYVADEEAWAYFEKDWGQALATAKVPWLHMRQFGNPTEGIYAHLKKDRNAEFEFIASLVEAIGSWVEYAPMCTVKIPDLRSFNAENGMSLDEYAVAVYGCIIEIRNRYPDEKISLIFDKFDKSMMHIERGLAYARRDQVKDLKVDHLTPIPLQDGESWRTIYPLQAADFIAWEIRKLCEERRDFTPNIDDRSHAGRLRDSFNAWLEQYEKENGRKPRFRGSIKALSADMWIGPRGKVLDRDILEQLARRQPNAWRPG